MFYVEGDVRLIALGCESFHRCASAGEHSSRCEAPETGENGYVGWKGQIVYMLFFILPWGFAARPAECSISTEPCHDTGGLIKITLINQERSQTSSLKMSCFSLLLFIYFPPRVLPLLVSAIFHPGNSPPALFPILTGFVSLDPLPHSHTHTYKGACSTVPVDLLSCLRPLYAIRGTVASSCPPWLGLAWFWSQPIRTHETEMTKIGCDTCVLRYYLKLRSISLITFIVLAKHKVVVNTNCSIV